jgi:trans-AT polyketide synthase/acyltransferase/oxidoreductase domain-containing protein
VNALAHAQRLDEGGAQADWLAGHSLGEYNALLAAGAFDFETGLRLVQRRGLLMASASDGGMMAVVDVTPDALRALLDRHGLDTIDISAYNTPRQTVIAGRPADLRAAADLLRAERMRAVPLSVSAPFHSRYMRPARIALARDLDTVKFRALATPVIANATARPYDSSRIAQTLGDQLVMPVRWTESIRALLDLGTTAFEEIGGTVLTKMVGEITSLHTA